MAAEVEEVALPDKVISLPLHRLVAVPFAGFDMDTPITGLGSTTWVMFDTVPRQPIGSVATK